MNNHFSSFDKYSNRISFFFNDREKIGTFFGLVLTVLYILFSLAIFCLYLVFNTNRENIIVSNSTKISKSLQKVDLNLISFAFGLTDSMGSINYIDETIYYPKIYFYEKNEINETEKELEYEICNNENFGEEYKSSFTQDELNNSYCIKNNYNNLTLSGAYDSKKMSYLNIKLFPCVNGSQNNNHCQPKEIINSYIKGGYFSVIIKDLSLDPSNKSSPLIQIIRNIYSIIDNSLYKNIVLNYGITEVKEHKGFKIKTKNYVQFRNKEEFFYLKNEPGYNKTEIISVDFKLNEIISVITIKYTNIIEIFSIIGGYMYIINTIFSLLSNLSNELIPDLKILNGIFNFNLKQKKMTLRIHNIKDFNTLVFKKSLYDPSERHTPDLTTKIPNNNNISKNSLIGMMDNNNINDNTSSQINILNNRKHNSLVIIKENENENSRKNSNDVKPVVYNHQNISFNNKNNNNNTPNITKKYIYRVGSFYPKLMENDKKNNSNNILKEYTDQINFNLFYYYCLKYCSSKNKNIELFKLGLSLYKKRMDIINVFTLLFYSEKNCLQTDELYY